MSRGRAWVEIVDGKIVRVFRNRTRAILTGQWCNVKEYPRRDAVRAIREAVFKRAENHCEHCGKIITSGSMHLHEKIFRSDGGEISLENSIALCYDCHMGREDSAHGNRLLQWTKG